MFDGLDLGTLLKLKNATDLTTYRVSMHSFGSEDGPTVAFNDDPTFTRTVVWVRENMEPVI